nr:phage exclusion protein Lit family protein [uncultured Sphingobacterium sp.]
MNWLFQKVGPINQYNDKIHEGDQPVRVVHPMLIYMFQNTNAQFLQALKEEIDAGKLNPTLGLEFGNVAIKKEKGLRTPRVNRETRQIELHETFLSYLWCCVYSIYVTYLETVDYPKINAQVGRIKYPISQQEIDQARNLLEYGRYLIVDFEEWNKQLLPNPEMYLAENRNYVEQTNLFYTEAVKFILCHEFTHLKHHIDKIDEETSSLTFLDFEMEADNNAIDMIKQGISYKDEQLATAHRLAVENGIVLGLISMFFFSSVTGDFRHPNGEDRLTNALERLGIEDNHYAWGIACIGLQFWDEQFGLNFEWSKDNLTRKEQYYRIADQIKARES